MTDITPEAVAILSDAGLIRSTVPKGIATHGYVYASTCAGRLVRYKNAFGIVVFTASPMGKHAHLPASATWEDAATLFVNLYKVGQSHDILDKLAQARRIPVEKYKNIKSMLEGEPEDAILAVSICDTLKKEL